MVLSNDAESDLNRKHLDLCDKLRLELRTSNEAWDNFQAINKNFTLEGDPFHWIGCAIYVAGWKSANPSAGQSYPHSTSLNFTALLRHCNLSLAHFFAKIRQWSDMANLPEEFTKKIEQLEKTVTVLCNVFSDYQSLFVKIFKAPEPDADQLKSHRNRKQKLSLCTPLRVFEFCWTLFIAIKEESNYSKDLVTLCRLLRAVCDWAFKNAFLADRRDLLNGDFEGLPTDWLTPTYIVPQEAPCIVNILSPDPDNIFVKYMKEYEFKTSIEKFFKIGKNAGEGKDDVFNASFFEQNFKIVTNSYETVFLTKGDFDERIFLAEYKRTLLEKEQNINRSQDAPLQHQNNDDSTNSEISKEMVVGQQCLTPLTGRKYLSPRECQNSGATLTTESISRLNNIINGCQPAPSPTLINLFESCVHNPVETINEIVSNLGLRFVDAFGSDQSEGNRRLQTAIILFYKLVENILQNERLIHSDISAIVEKQVFYECMFACCLEIVIHAHNSRRSFPWVLEALKVQSYNFIKVIELIIRSKDKLSRDTIKHLNMIEEMILSSLVWKADSLVWEAIASSEKEIPKFEETALPGHLQNENNSENSTLRNILNSESKQMQSPGPSATDRFQSPVAHASAVNRELFPSVQSNQSLLQHTHLMIKDRTGNTRMIPIVNSEIQKTQTPANPRREQINATQRPRRTGGLSILFRKFYNLSGERMEHLCTHLKITNTDTKRKIWTVFEELIRKNHCELMKDRDLDQLLMCAVYMICKLTKLNKSFAEIIKSYRSQPQSTSDIYRQVLISTKQTKVIDGVTVEIPENRGDLIQFYNTVIIQAMKKFAQKFVKLVDKCDDHSGDVLLSPLPASRGQVVQVFDNIFVKPLESPTTLGFGNGKVYNYYFSRSPSKDLKDINKAIRGNGVQGKRLLIEGENELPNAKRIEKRKVQSMIEERRNQNTE